MPDIQEMYADKEFQLLPPKQKRLLVADYMKQDVEFNVLPPQHQAKLLNEAQGQFPDESPVTSTATAQIGKTPYKWGGEDLNKGADCSGFTCRIYEKAGKKLPRTAREQYKVGTPVQNVADLQPGDQIFFKGTQKGLGPNDASHTGIYLGDGRFVHSSSAKGNVVEDDLNKAYWKKKWLGAKRHVTTPGGNMPIVNGAVEEAVAAQKQKLATKAQVAENVRRAAAELNMTPEQARARLQDTDTGIGTYVPSHPISALVDAKLSRSPARIAGVDAGLRTATPFIGDATERAVDALAGQQGAMQELNKMKGALPAVARMAASALSPVDALAGGAIGGALMSAPKAVQLGVAGAFGGPAVAGGVQRAKEGDVSGGATEAALGIGALLLPGLIGKRQTKAMNSKLDALQNGESLSLTKAGADKIVSVLDPKKLQAAGMDVSVTDAGKGKVKVQIVSTQQGPAPANVQTQKPSFIGTPTDAVGGIVPPTEPAPVQPPVAKTRAPRKKPAPVAEPVVSSEPVVAKPVAPRKSAPVAEPVAAPAPAPEPAGVTAGTKLHKPDTDTYQTVLKVEDGVAHVKASTGTVVKMPVDQLNARITAGKYNVVPAKSAKPAPKPVEVAKPVAVANAEGDAVAPKPSNSFKGKREYVDHVDFERPIVGATGKKVTGYQWSNKKTLKWSTAKQEYVEAKVSDWDGSSLNETTNREIVHKFFVENEDGTGSYVSLETAAKMLNEDASVLKTAMARTRTDALNQMKEASLKGLIQQIADAKAKYIADAPDPTEGPSRFRKGYSQFSIDDHHMLFKTGDAQDRRNAMQSVKQEWATSKAMAEAGVSRHTNLQYDLEQLQARMARRNSAKPKSLDQALKDLPKDANIGLDPRPYVEVMRAWGRENVKPTWDKFKEWARQNEFLKPGDEAVMDEKLRKHADAIFASGGFKPSTRETRAATPMPIIPKGVTNEKKPEVQAPQGQVKQTADATSSPIKEGNAQAKPVQEVTDTDSMAGKNAVSDRILAEMNRPLRELPNKRPWEQAFQEAQAKGLTSPEKIQSILNTNKRKALTDTETVALAHARAEAIDRMNSFNEKAYAGDMDAIISRKEAEDYAVKLTNKLIETGTAQGRALNARKWDPRSYDTPSVIARATATKGAPLTEKELALHRSDAEKVQKAQEATTAAEAAQTDPQAYQKAVRLAAEVKVAGESSYRARARTKNTELDALKARYGILKQKTPTKMRRDQGAVGIDPEAVKIVGEMMKNRIEYYALSAADGATVVARSLRDVQNMDPDLKEAAILNAMKEFMAKPARPKPEVAAEIKSARSAYAEAAAAQRKYAAIDDLLGKAQQTHAQLLKEMQNRAQKNPGSVPQQFLDSLKKQAEELVRIKQNQATREVRLKDSLASKQEQLTDPQTSAVKPKGKETFEQQLNRMLGESTVLRGTEMDQFTKDVIEKHRDLQKLVEQNKELASQIHERNTLAKMKNDAEARIVQLQKELRGDRRVVVEPKEGRTITDDELEALRRTQRRLEQLAEVRINKHASTIGEKLDTVIGTGKLLNPVSRLFDLAGNEAQFAQEYLGSSLDAVLSKALWNKPINQTSSMIGRTREVMRGSGPEMRKELQNTLEFGDSEISGRGGGSGNIIQRMTGTTDVATKVRYRKLLTDDLARKRAITDIITKANENPEFAAKMKEEGAFAKERDRLHQQYRDSPTGDMDAWAAEYALRNTFNAPNAMSQYMAGGSAQLLNRARNTSLNKVDRELAGMAYFTANTLTRFTKVITNVLANGIDYTPVGIVHGAVKRIKANPNAVDFTPVEAREITALIRKGLVGTAAMTLFGKMASNGVGEEKLYHWVDDGRGGGYMEFPEWIENFPGLGRSYMLATEVGYVRKRYGDEAAKHQLKALMKFFTDTPVVSNAKRSTDILRGGATPATVGKFVGSTLSPGMPSYIGRVKDDKAGVKRKPEGFVEGAKVGFGYPFRDTVRSEPKR